ncbi:ester cyclase [Acidobacteriota bacterium]
MKKQLFVIPVALFLCLAVGCQDRAAVSELEGFQAQAKAEVDNTSLVKRYIETINAGNYDAMGDFLSPEYSIYSPSGHPEPTSREKLIENYKGVAQAFSEFKWDVVDIMAAGDKVICRMKVKGTTKAGVPGLPDAPTQIEIGMITIMRFENGKIAEEWQEDDQLGFARQLGMELKPKEEK